MAACIRVTKIKPEASGLRRVPAIIPVSRVDELRMVMISDPEMGCKREATELVKVSGEVLLLDMTLLEAQQRLEEA